MIRKYLCSILLFSLIFINAQAQQKVKVSVDKVPNEKK